MAASVVKVRAEVPAVRRNKRVRGAVNVQCALGTQLHYVVSGQAPNRL